MNRFFLYMLLIVLVSCKSVSYNVHDVEKKNVYLKYRPSSSAYTNSIKNYRTITKVNLELNRKGYYLLEFEELTLDFTIKKSRKLNSFKRYGHLWSTNEFIDLNGLESIFCATSLKHKNIVKCKVIDDNGLYLGLFDSLGKCRATFPLSASNIKVWRNRKFRKQCVVKNRL